MKVKNVGDVEKQKKEVEKQTRHKVSRSPIGGQRKGEEGGQAEVRSITGRLMHKRKRKGEGGGGGAGWGG